jgi:hypothetical protein
MFANLDVRGNFSGNEATFLSDMVAIITGETDKNNLTSPGIDLTGTFITNTVASNWTLVEQVSSLEVVLRSACDGDAAQFKYVRLRIDTFSNQIRFFARNLESWDPAVGQSAEVQGGGPRGDTATYGIQPMEIYATPRCLWFRSTGYSTSKAIYILSMELTRTAPWLAVGSGYTPAVMISPSFASLDTWNSYLVYMPRILTYYGADVLAAVLNGTANCGTYTQEEDSNYTDVLSDVCYDDANVINYFIHLLQIERKNLVGGIIGTSELAGMFTMQSNTVANTPAALNDSTTHDLDGTDDVIIKTWKYGSDIEDSLRTLWPSLEIV